MATLLPSCRDSDGNKAGRQGQGEAVSRRNRSSLPFRVRVSHLHQWFGHGRGIWYGGEAENASVTQRGGAPVKTQPALSFA